MKKSFLSKQLLFNVLKILFSVVLVSLLLSKIGVQKIFEHLVDLQWIWLLTSVAAFVGSNLLGAMQWWLLLKSKNVNVPLLRTISFYHVGLFFNNFLIGYVGGDAFRIYDIRKYSGDTTSAFSTVFFDRFVGFFALTSLAMFVTLFWIRHLSMAVFLTIMIVLIGWIVGLYFLFKENVAKRFSWIFKLVLPKFFYPKLREIYFAINEFRHSRLLLVRIMLIAFLVQSLRVLTHYFAARAVGVDVNIVYFFIFIPIVAMAASLPISLGGIGVRETSAVRLFLSVGVLADKIAAFEFLAYCVGILAALPGGLIFSTRKELQGVIASTKVNNSD